MTSYYLVRHLIFSKNQLVIWFPKSNKNAVQLLVFGPRASPYPACPWLCRPYPWHLSPFLGPVDIQALRSARKQSSQTWWLVCTSAVPDAPNLDIMKTRIISRCQKKRIGPTKRRFIGQSQSAPWINQKRIQVNTIASSTSTSTST